MLQDVLAITTQNWATMFSPSNSEVSYEYTLSYSYVPDYDGDGDEDGHGEEEERVVVQLGKGTSASDISYDYVFSELPFVEGE